jgi:hypothetical protein
VVVPSEDVPDAAVVVDVVVVCADVPPPLLPQAASAPLGRSRIEVSASDRQFTTTDGTSRALTGA